MILIWLIGILIVLYALLLFKNTRQERRNLRRVIREEGPVLKLWKLILFIPCGLIPIVNIIMGASMLIWWHLSITQGDWFYVEKGSALDKFNAFLRKPIT